MPQLQAQTLSAAATTAPSLPTFEIISADVVYLVGGLALLPAAVPPQVLIVRPLTG